MLLNILSIKKAKYIFTNIKFFGNYREKCPVQIWKRYIPLLKDLLISNKFSSMTFFFAQRIFYELLIVKVYVYTTVLDRHKIQDSDHSDK